MNTLIATRPVQPGPRIHTIAVIACINSNSAAENPLADELALLLASHAAEFGFSLLPTQAQCAKAALDAIADDQVSAVVFASTDLTKNAMTPELQAGKLVHQLREASAGHKKPLALLALGERHTDGIGGIDAFLSPAPEITELANVAAKIANMLALKLPPIRREFSSDNAIRLQVALKEQELTEAFRLRFKVYNALGYVSSDDSPGGGMDIDAFDKLSLQLIVLDHRKSKVIGTFRMVLDRPAPFASAHFDERPAKILDRQRSIVDTIVHRRAGARIKRDYGADTPLLLPIFKSMDFSDRWLKQFGPILGKCCEISRVVIEPSYRGMGLLDLIMRSASAIAYDLGKSVVLLECSPHHIPMYEKYGYKTIGLHGTCRELDQRAAGMRLDITGRRNDPQTHMSTRLIRMLSSQPAPPLDGDKARYLCACTFPNCWQNGAYSFRTSHHCPLSQWREDQT